MAAINILTFGQQPFDARTLVALSLTFTLFAIMFYLVTATRSKSVEQPLTTILNLYRRWKKSWAYLLNGRSLIQSGYETSSGQPYEVLAPDCRMIFASSAKHIKELDQAPDSVLSLNGAAKHMLQPIYTMNGFNWFDRRGVEGVRFVKTLRTLLTNNLPQLLPRLSIATKVRLDEHLSRYATTGDAIRSPIYPMKMDIVVLLNATSLFGEELARNDQFMKAARAYVEETLICAEIVKLVPNFLAPVIGGILSHRLNNHKAFFNCLVPAAQERVQERELKALGHKFPSRSDCIQWIVETSPKNNPWSAERVIYELMAIWFGSVHILTTTLVWLIHDLCDHPEYVEPLREELQTSYADFERSAKGLPLLDSFLKESARLTPVESMSVRRCALAPFTFSDGTRLAPGDRGCAPSGAINLKEEYYPSPHEFSGFRFVDPAIIPDKQSPQINQGKPSKLVDVDESFLMWGTGRMACPGRYYSSAFMKVIVGQIIMNYDVALVEPSAPRWFSWRAALLPKDHTLVTFTPLEKKI